MKKLFFVASVLATGTVCASAADLPVKAPPIVPAVFNWTGGYGGIAGGYGWGHSDQTDPGIAPPPVADNGGGEEGLLTATFLSTADCLAVPWDIICRKIGGFSDWRATFRGPISRANPTSVAP